MATEGRDESHHRAKAQQLHRRNTTSEARSYDSAGLVCISQEITSDCAKGSRPREVIQKSCLVSKSPNLTRHSGGNSMFQAKWKHAYDLSEGPRGKPEEKTK